MKQINCYLMFDGNCREAMTFYAKVLESEIYLVTFAEAPNCPQGAAERIMHGQLTKGEAVLMASDTPQQTVVQGDNFKISLSTDTVEETDRIFAALSEGGTATMPPQDMFWGAYFGMLTDKFGIAWMLNYEKTKQ